MAKFTPPFRMGDVVVFSKPYITGSCNGKPSYSSGKIGQNHIIAVVRLNGDSFTYSTSRGAWIPHESFTLVRECDKKSINALKKTLAEEEEL